MLITRLRHPIFIQKRLSSTLIYTGPQANTIRAFKATASIFSLCAIIATPTLFFYGHDPLITSTIAAISGTVPLGFIHWATKSYVTKAYLNQPTSGHRHIRSPHKLLQPDVTLTLETLGPFGTRRQHHISLDWLQPITIQGKVRQRNWQIVPPSNAWKGQRDFFIEPTSLHPILNEIQKQKQQQQQQQ
jgi:hypothetical protein